MNSPEPSGTAGAASLDADPPADKSKEDIAALAKGGRTNIFGFLLRLAARLPFLFIAGRLYGGDDSHHLSVHHVPQQ